MKREAVILDVRSLCSDSGIAITVGSFEDWIRHTSQEGLRSPSLCSFPKRALYPFEEKEGHTPIDGAMALSTRVQILEQSNLWHLA